tara:strand:+ start:127 stop:402 length:276 start_codon:yes stop_codon:yes gene_type:complete
MKSKIELEIDNSDPFSVTIVNSNGDTFGFPKNSRNEGLVDFLYSANKLPINNVNQQRELLVAFCKRLEKNGGNNFVNAEWIVDNFLATNCG